MPDDANPCAHNDIRSTVTVTHLRDDESGPVTGHMADICIQCTECGVLFKFLGLPMGMNLNGAATNVTRDELRVAISPDGLATTPYEPEPGGDPE